ncbi:hypothetical protein MGYG_09188 [Nannizzia gypsea CBS 118893]|uniref:Uncharacterized protein n=1 Tax=Arthroderma gypseum (strain ATCC MYA-4604 / CBS 118893) TaxID=535722 RepID=E4V4Z8_ARTGP|nr:hypothetical protein MGYG_09188 [Nannizzia gypsea CBS 118893]EFR05072.1 hypothetical protein MGYG_09188 [Nannizzia gypsea CBS 118893]
MADMTSSAHHVPSRDNSRRSVGSATSGGSVKRSWSFSRLFGMRFDRQVDQPPALVPDYMETADCSLYNTRNPHPGPDTNFRSTWSNFRFFSHQRTPAPPETDRFAQSPLRRAKSTQGFFTGSFKAKSFFKRASTISDQDDRNKSDGDDFSSADSDSDDESDALSTFAPIQPGSSPAVQSTRSLGETHGSQEISERTRRAIFEESKGLHPPGLGSAQPVVSVSRRLRNYFRKNRNVRSPEASSNLGKNYADQQQPPTERDIARQRLLEESLLICPEEFPVAAQRLMSGGITANSSYVASLSAVSLRGHGCSTISLSLTASSPQLPTHLRYMVEAIDRLSGEHIIESTTNPP